MFVVQNDPTGQQCLKNWSFSQYPVLTFLIVFCGKIQCRCVDLICCLTVNCTEPHTHRLSNEDKQPGTKSNWLFSGGSPISSTLQTWWGAEVPVLVASSFCKRLKVSILVFIMVPKKMLIFMA